MKEIAISEVDALFASGSYPIELLFLYKEGFSTKKIRRALRQLAPRFWPVFGEFAAGVISYDRFREEDFYEEESVGRALDPAEFESAGPEVLGFFGPAKLPKLFFLKVTRFTNGLVLVPKMNHVAGDGYSYFFLLSALAALARAAFVPVQAPFVKALFKPHHRRTCLKGFSFRSSGPAPLAQGRRLTVESLDIPKREVQTLVRETASMGTVRVSSNDVISAMVLKRLKASRLTIPIDVRSQVKEYGRRFFGNGIMLHTIELGGDRPDDLPVKEAAAFIRRSMPRVSRESYIRYLEVLEQMIADKRWDEFRPYDPDRGCLVTNLSKLPAEKIDFGTGGPEAIIPLTVEKNSVAILSRGDHYVLRIAY